jgi:hypothetical protein
VFCLAPLIVTPNWEVDGELLELVHCIPQNLPLLAISEVRAYFGLVEGDTHLKRRASEARLLERRWRVVVYAAKEENSNGALEDGAELPIFAGGYQGLHERTVSIEANKSFRGGEYVCVCRRSLCKDEPA